MNKAASFRAFLEGETRVELIAQCIRLRGDLDTLKSPKGLRLLKLLEKREIIRATVAHHQKILDRVNRDITSEVNS